MRKRYFNWKLAIVLVIGFVVLGATAFGLRQWQRGRRAERALEAGNKAYNEQRWEEAARNLGRYLAVTHGDMSTLLKYAYAQLNIRPVKLNNVRQAIAAYRTVLRIDKNNSEAAKYLVEIYLAMGVPGEAELIASRYLETNQDPKLQIMLAMALARQRKFDEAAAELKRTITKHPEQVLAYETLGKFIEQRPENFSELPLHWFNEAVKNNPSLSLAYIIRADFHLRNGDTLKAVADLEQAEKQDLSDPAVRLRLAEAFINADALEEAEKHLVLVQKAVPTNQALWETWARLALKSRAQAKILKVAETGLKELSSQPWDFMPTAAELFIQCGQLDRAVHCISKLRQKDFAPMTVAFLEGLVAEKEEKPFEAIKCWRRAMELGNKSPRIRLALASTLSRLGDTKSALRELRLLISESPNFFEGRLALVRLLAQVGNWSEAIEHARRAMQMSPESLEAVLLHLQGQIQLLATRPPAENVQMLQAIESQLARLENVKNGSLEVKLLQFQIALHRDNFNGAESLLLELKQVHPSQIQVPMAEVELLVAQEKDEEAIVLLSKMIEQFPQAIEPVRYLAILFERQGNHKECEKVIKDALVRIEQSVVQRELGLLLAQIYTQWKEEDKAYKLLDALAEKLPDDIPIKRRILDGEVAIKNPTKAQQLVNDINSLEGEAGWQWRYEQARLWFRREDFKSRYPQIISLLNENLLANPDDQDSRILLAATYERSGELQLAVSTFSDALLRSPGDLRVIIPIVATLYRAKEYDRADEILNRALQEKLYHPQLQKLHLQSHLRRGQLSSASDILQDLLSTDPDNQAVCLSLALLKMRQNDFDEANELLTKLKIQEPNSVTVTAAQIQLNIQQDKPEEALKLSNEIVSKLNTASAYILRARTYAMLGQNDKAIEDFEHATSIEPNNLEAWVAGSDFYRSKGLVDRAAANILQALSLAPNSIQVQKRAISLFLTSDQPDRVRQGSAILEEALQSNPKDVELRLFKARLLLTEGTAPAIENAVLAIRKITEDQPDLSDAWVLLGEVALRRGQFAEAMDVALRGLIHRPDDKSLLLLKAKLEAMRSPALSIPTLKALRELDPNDADIAVQLANTYLAAGQFEQAVGLLRTQLTACSNPAPDERKIKIALAAALHKTGNNAESQKIFHSLYQSVPDDPSPLLTEARLLKDDKLWNQLSQKTIDWYQNHNPEHTQVAVNIASDVAFVENSQAKKAAEEILRTILENDSDCTEAMSVLATLLQVTGRFVESATLYQRILTLQPDNPVAINNLAWIMCEEQGKYQQALELAQRGLKIAPQYIDLIDTRGVIYYRLGEFNKAIQDFTTCIELYPSETPSCVTSRSHLGRALAKIGRKHEAMESLKEALESNAKIGGLSQTEIVEAQRLLEELSQGG